MRSITALYWVRFSSVSPSRYHPASVALVSGEVTSTNRHRCWLPPEGARMAASMMRATTSSGIGSGFTRRMARVV